MANYYTRSQIMQRAETVAKVIVRDIVSRYGVLHSDRGANFEGKVMKELSSLLRMRKVKTTAYHPQCDGLVERLNQTILTMLSKHVADHQKDWDMWLPCVLLAYRSAKQSSTAWYVPIQADVREGPKASRRRHSEQCTSVQSTFLSWRGSNSWLGS